MLKIFSLFSILFCSLAFAKDKTKSPLIWSGNLYKIIHEFEEVHDKFSKEICRAGDEKKYYELLRAYRGQGYYLPKYKGQIDKKAIKKNLHHYKQKIAYIAAELKKLKNQKEYPSFGNISAPLEDSLKKLLEFKKKDHQNVSKEQKALTLTQSQNELIRFKQLFKTFLDQVYFLKSYNFPNDYLMYREKYELYRYGEPVKDELANEVFFYRKIIEDGAMDSDNTWPDKYLRTTLDTLYLNVQKEVGFLSENVRYDLNWSLRGIENNLKRGKTKQLERLAEWKKRTEESLGFYEELLLSKNKKKALFLVKKENEATHELKDFVYKKQAEVYRFWQKQSELNRSLFSLESILVNEVGTLDGPDALEREAVAKVVFNRYYNEFYSKLEDDQAITDFLGKKERDDKWLNVLFKVGEFSFTYHYIPAVVKTFCPDMSKRGKNVRDENLKIILKAAKDYDGSFDAFRYFSRISMLGKIDMSSVWYNYKKIPEMPGHLSTDQRALLRHYLADKFDYLYSFFDSAGVEYDVLIIDGTTYSMRLLRGKPTFFDYRNPHLFTYFSKK